MRVFVDGGEGTTGLRIRERLALRADVKTLSLPEETRKDERARKALAGEADVIFLCLPDAAAGEAAAMYEGLPAVVIDASTRHRTHPDWAYGFPELSPAHRERVRTGARISVPGCHASGFVALVYPLVTAGVLAPDYPLVCHSVTGYSGGGKKMIAEYEAAARDAALASPRQYALSQAHKHLPEMTAVPGLAFSPAFSPIVADFFAGMVVTVPLFSRLMKKARTLAELREVFAAHYAGQPLVRVLPESGEGAFFAANALAGQDGMEITVAGNDERPLLLSRFDNLGKGASGAAIQCMNIRMGIEETSGLRFAREE